MSSALSIVISCAGIGSRLGLSKTKALITIDGETLISKQLKLFKDVDDIRIVLGFQANEVVSEVLKYRKDVIFIYNHNYFETKTASSFYLGARDANEYVIGVDGDLVICPDDIDLLLKTNGEYIAYSEKKSDDAIFVKTNELGDVIEFSKKHGDFEWTGPACIKKEKIEYSSGNVYNQLEKYLPMKGIKIRAFDIDTYDDYKRASDIIKLWNILGDKTI